MKKCYWCAEKIQDEAKICRFCGRAVVDPPSPTPVRSDVENLHQYDPNPNIDVPEPVGLPPGSTEAERLLHYYPDPDRETHKPVNLPPVTPTENIPQVETKELPPLKWHQRLIWRAIFFGIFMGVILYNYVLGSTSPFGVFGFSGYLSNAVLQGISSVVIYSGLYLLLGGIYRGSIKKRKSANFQERQAILKSEAPFIIGAIFFFVLGLFGIEKLISNSDHWTSTEPTIMNISTETIFTEIIATPTNMIATPTNVVSKTDIDITRQERALISSIFYYKHKQGWSFKPYLDDLDLVIDGNKVIITLLKSPVTEEEFREVAYELIRVTAFHVINGPITANSSDRNLDFDIYNIRVLSEGMADYTIAGYIEGYGYIKKMAETKSRDLVTYEKYYD